MSACYYSNNKVKLLDSAIMWFKVLIKESNKLDCYFSIRPNKAFLVPDWCRANDKKKQQYKCSCYTGHPQKPLERQLFLLFSIKFGSCSWFFRHCRINTIYVHSVLNKTLLALAPKQAKMLAKQALFKACF
jgi:hypothetical protein